MIGCCIDLSEEDFKGISRTCALPFDTIRNGFVRSNFCKTKKNQFQYYLFINILLSMNCVSLFILISGEQMYKSKLLVSYFSTDILFKWYQIGQYVICSNTRVGFVSTFKTSNVYYCNYGRIILMVDYSPINTK